MIAALAVATVVAADGLVAYVVAELFAGAYEPGEQRAVRAPIFVIVSLVAYGHLRLAGRYDLSSRQRAAWLTAVPFVTLYGSLRLEFSGDFAIWDFGWALDFLRDSPRAASEGGHAVIGTLFLLPVWMRSAYRASDDPDLEALPRSLAVPFTIVTVVVVLGAFSSRADEVARGGAAFYLLALLGLAFSQLALSGASIGALRIGEVTGTLFGAILAGVLAALVVLTILFGILAPVVGPPLERGITAILTVVLTPPAWLLYKLFSLLFAGAGFSQIELPDRILGEGTPEAATPEEGDSLAGAIFKVLARMIGLAGVLGIVVVAVALVARYRKRTLATVPAIGVTASGSLGEDVAGWFRSLLPGFRRRDDGRRAQAGVYALYADVLARSHERGHPRPAEDTPREFAPELSETFHARITDDITAAFEAARYGGHEPDQHTLDNLRSSWREVQ